MIRLSPIFIATSRRWGHVAEGRSDCVEGHPATATVLQCLLALRCCNQKPVPPRKGPAGLPQSRAARHNDQAFGELGLGPRVAGISLPTCGCGRARGCHATFRGPYRSGRRRGGLTSRARCGRVVLLGLVLGTSSARKDDKHKQSSVILERFHSGFNCARYRKRRKALGTMLTSTRVYVVLCFMLPLACKGPSQPVSPPHTVPIARPPAPNEQAKQSQRYQRPSRRS